MSSQKIIIITTQKNRLILQEAPKDNQIQNIYQQQEPVNKSSILLSMIY